VTAVDPVVTSGGVPADPVVATAGRSRWRVVLGRLATDRGALLGALVLVLMVLTAFLAPHLYPYDYQRIDPSALLQPPNAEHWFGTTAIGQDVVAQTLRGLQKSLIIAVLVALASTTVAALVGATSGYLGGATDRVLTWITEVLLVVPSFVIVAICSPWFRGRNFLILVALLAAFGWMVASRMIRAITLSLREREYVRAARYMGARRRTVIVRHILPAMASVLIVDATLNTGVAIVGESTLSYFGFGVQRPDISLGTLIADGTASALTYPWLFLFCIGALVLVVLSVNLIGDGLRDAFDPSGGRASR
jgi:peptide/nickel transport system permease protein